MRVGAVIVVTDNMFCTEEIEKLVKADRPILFERVILNFQRIGVKDIVLVSGQHKALMEKNLQHNGVTFLGERGDYPEGVTCSVKKGLDYLKECDKILLTPMEAPFWKPETVATLLEKSGELIVPIHNYEEGFPICINPAGREKIVGSKEIFAKSVADFVRKLDIELVYAAVEDRGINTRTRTEEAYERLRTEFESAQKVYPGVKVRLENKRPFFGPGTVTLLRQIDRIGSVREACARTGMSYSKGWKLIKVAEEESGYQLVERTPGGKNGGEAYVTERGKQLLHLFEEYTNRVEQAAEEIYNEIFLDSDLF